MYVTVKLINGYPRPLTYKVPTSLTVPLGAVVNVPLQQRVERALVVSAFVELPAGTKFKVREMLGIEPMPDDTWYHPFIARVSSYYVLDPCVLYRRISHVEEQEEELVVAEDVQPAKSDVLLTADQQQIVDALAPTIGQQTFQASVLHGVTGSGKTEVYKRLIEHAFTQGLTTILLLPEVSLAVNFTNLLRAQLASSIAVYGFHSASPAADKRALWAALYAGTPIVVVGVHLPIFLPIVRLGLIIIDEEHDVGFQEKKHPRINTKEVALMRAQFYKVPILLGSATPSLSSLYAVAERGWNFFQLKQRFAGTFPKISLVSLVNEKKRREFWISGQLQAAIADRLARGEQAIIFLNRRGHSFFMQCSACSFIFSCTSCSVSFTYHDDDTLACHYCGVSAKAPICCSACKSKELLKKGVGTQQIVTILKRLFPQARIERADADSTRNKKKWQQLCLAMKERQVDILVGTQTITKGYHFPGVTLVGIIWAELNLSMPFYNAAEVTLQQLIQVAGRAGRAASVGVTSEVVIQTFVEHPVFNYINEVSYPDFYTYELQYRKEMNYPPCVRFAEFELRHADEKILHADVQHCTQILFSEIDARKLAVTVLGPSKPPVYKIKGVHMMRFYLKSDDMKAVAILYRVLLRQGLESAIFFTPNPLS